MPILNQLNYATPATSDDPVQSAKATLLKNLNAQLEAARLIAEGKPSPLSARGTWFNRHDQEGNLLFGVRVRNKALEIQRGKPFIVAGDTKKLPGVIEKIIAAVKAGELDPQITARVAEPRAPRKPREPRKPA